MTVLADNAVKNNNESLTTWVGKYLLSETTSIAKNSTVFQISALSEEAQILLQKLTEFKLLPENWDSYGAEKPPPGLINIAKTWVRKLDELNLPLFFVVPGPNGEISIELKKGKMAAELILEDEESIELLVSKNGELTNEDVYEDKGQLINNLLSIFSVQ